MGLVELLPILMPQNPNPIPTALHDTVDVHPAGILRSCVRSQDAGRLGLAALSAVDHVDMIIASSEDMLRYLE